MARANDSEEMTTEEDETNTRLRLLLLNVELNRILQQIAWEKESFALRNPGSVIK